MEAPAPREAAVHEDVLAAWQRITEDWNDLARHEAFIGAAAQHTAFAWAAARYREREDDPLARSQLDRLRRAATATMMASAATRKDEERTPYRSTIIMLIFMLAFMVMGLVCTKVIGDNTPPAQPTKPARP